MAATITTVTAPTNAGVLAAFAASTVAGDAVAWKGGKMLLEFRNTTGSSITVTIAPIATTVSTSNAGSMTPATRSIAIAASAEAVFEFSDGDVGAYLDTSGLINIAYTSGNVGLLVRALKVA